MVAETAGVPIRRGEIWLADLDPMVGSETRKTSPCVVVSPPEINAHLRRVIVAPMATGSRPARFRVPLAFQERQGLILLDRMRTLDRQRLVRRLDAVDADTLRHTLDRLRALFAE